MTLIELLLVQMCSRKIAAYVQQDMIKRDTLSRYCSCSGSWVNKDVDATKLREQLAIVKSKAVFHGMKWLQESLERFGIV